MIPLGSEAVDHLATRIAVDLIPKAADAYMGADLGMLSGLIRMVGQDFDRAAQVLVSDKESLCAILEVARPNITDPALKTRMDAVLSSTPASLSIPDLNADGDVAMRVLIDLHAAVEDVAEATGADWARELDLSIWSFLDAYVAKRAYDSAF